MPSTTNNNNQKKPQPKALDRDQVIGRFSGPMWWKYWAGVHRLYHQQHDDGLSSYLIILRDLLLPLTQLLCMFRLLAYVLPFAYSGYNVGHVLVGLLSLIYLPTDLVTGGLFTHILWNLNNLASQTPVLINVFVDVVATISATLLPVVAAWWIGPHHDHHRDYCVLATKPRVDAIAVLLNPYFHFVELMLTCGYRPALNDDIRIFKLLAEEDSHTKTE